MNHTEKLLEDDANPDEVLKMMWSMTAYSIRSRKIEPGSKGEVPETNPSEAADIVAASLMERSYEAIEEAEQILRKARGDITMAEILVANIVEYDEKGEDKFAILNLVDEALVTSINATLEVRAKLSENMSIL